MRVNLILLSLSLPLCMHAQAQILLPDQRPDPAFANLVFWMDAADPATITFGAGTSVSAWLDKAGGRSLTPISGTSIALGTGSHGMPTVNFTGASGMQLSDLVVPVNDADGMCAFVIAKTNPGTDRSTLMSRSGQNVQFFREDRQTDIVFYKGTNPDPRIVNAGEKADHVHFFAINSTLANPDKITFSRDATPQTVQNNTQIGTQDWVLNRFGGNGGCCGNWKGEISEVLIFDRMLSAAEEGDVGAYLSAKYGITTGYSFANGTPVITGLDGDAFTYTPGSGATVIDQGTTAGADDPPPGGLNGWSNGTLRVEIAAGLVGADDVLSILDEGAGAGAIGFDGSTVTYEGVAIGSATGGAAGTELLITFNPGSSTVAIAALVDNITFLNANPGTSPLSRQVVFTLTDGDGASSAPSTVQINLNVGGAIDTFVWDGGGDGTTFSEGANWVGDPGAGPDANDIAIFRDAGTGSIDLGGGASVGELRFDGTGSFSLDNGPLVVPVIDQQAAAGNNVIDARVEAIGIAGTVAGGRLTLNNLANSFSGTLTVNGGATLQADVLASQSGLGQADIALGGGTLELLGLPTEEVNRLFHYGYQPTNNPQNADLDLDQNGGLMGDVPLPGGDPTLGPGFTSRTILTDGPGNRGLDFNNDADFINTGVIDQNDQYANLFIGTLNVSAADAGDWTFRRAADDDAMGIWLDLDRDGIFESTTPGLGSNRGEQLQWDNDGGAKTVNLSEGAYLIAFTHREGGGGSQIDVRLSTPNLAEEILKPTDPDQDGFFSVNQKSEGHLVNTVRGLATSRIRSDALITLDALEITTALELEIDGEGVVFENTVLDGDLSVVTTNKAPLSLGLVSGAGGLIQNGNGRLLLPTPNSYAGLTTINAGVIRTDASNALGQPGMGTRVQANGSLQVFGGTHAEPLELHGTGNTTSDGALSKATGANVTWTGLITIPDDARIYSVGNQLFLDGGISLTGTNLTLDAQNRINVRVNGLTGGPNATVRFEGNDRTDLEIASPDYLGDIELFNDGYLDVHRSGALGDSNGVTRITGDNTTLLFRNLTTHVEDLELEGDGRGTIGAIRVENNTIVLDGSITLTGDATIVTRNNSSSTLTVLGPVLGGHGLTQRENATLALTQDNDIGNFDLYLGGTTRISTPGGLGSTDRLVLDAGETLAFDGTMSLDGSTLRSLALNGGTLRSDSGKTTLDLPIELAAEAGFNVDGAGDLDILSSIGNGDLPIAPPGALSHFGFHTDNMNLAMNIHTNGGMVNGVPPDPAAATNLNFFGQAFLTDGPDGRGLDFNNDADWQATGAIGTNQNDRYSNLIIGYLNVSATQAGDWQFRRLSDDDQIGIWLDLDRNGIFESDPVGFGSNRGEQIQWDGDGGIKTHNLAEGRYLFAVTHREGTGNSHAHVQFKSPLMASLANIKPSDFGQAGIWEPLAGTPGTVQPANALNKTGQGILTLAGDNTFNREVNILGGMLVAAHANALGTDSNIYSRVSSLGLSGGVSIAGKTLHAGGVSTEPTPVLVNLDGDNQFLGDLRVSDYPSPTVSSTVPGGRLSLGNPGHLLDLAGSALTLDGPGDIVVNSDISNTSGTISINALQHYGYHGRNNNLFMNLDNNGGMMGGGNPATFQDYHAQVPLTSGPGDRGLDFNNDQDFQNAGAIDPTRPDNYSNLFLGNLVVSPTEAGDWEFRRVVDDDQMGIWLDIDRDGVFESTSPGLGSDRGEQLQWDNDNGTKTVTLTAGTHRFAVTHSEGGGGSQVHVQFKAPSMPAQLTINPADPAQAGIWQLIFPAGNSVVKQGSGTTTLAGNNSYTGETRVLDGTLVAGSPAALGDTGDGTWVQGGTLALPSGSTYNTAETLSLSGVGPTNMPGALVSLGGSTTLDPPAVIVAPSNAVVVGIGSLAGTFTLNPDIDLVAGGLLVDGTGDTVINGVISGLGKATSIPAPPFAGPFTFDKVGAPDFDTEGWLVESGFAGSHNRGGDIALSAGRSAGDHAWDNAHPTTLLSSPPFVLDGSGDPITFELHGGMLSGNQGANTTPAPTNVSQVLAVANSDNLLGVQGVGLRRVDTGEYVLTASSSANNTADENFSWPVAGLPDTAYTFDFFDYYHGGWGWVDMDNVVLPGLDLDQGLAVDNHLVKNGDGSLTLNAINTYDGGTTVSGGVLVVHGGTGPSNVVVSSGAVLMGSGTIDGTVLVASRGGTNPGTSPGLLSVGEHLAYANYSSVFHAELQGPAVAGSDYDQLDVGGQIVLSQATLLLARDPAYTPSDTDVLTIAQGSSVTGTFNGIAEGQRISAQGAEFVVSYLNNEITLNATGGLLTYAGPDTITRPTIAGVPAAAVSVPASQLLANDLVGDGVGPLVITGVISNSIENGSVSFDGSTVTYTAAMGYGEADSFTYTVSDGTDSAIGLVTVTPSETSTGAAATGDPAGLLTLPNGDYRITFTGTPGISYQLQWSEDLGATPVVWQVLGSVVADAQGQIILDHPAPPPRVYYRAALE